MTWSGIFSKKELSALAKNVARLSNLLTKERHTLPSTYLRDEGLRQAYLLYFLPSNLYKIHIPLKELSLHPLKILSRERLRILDIGAGPGTAILGIMGFFSTQETRPSLDFTAVDPVAENLKDVGMLFKSFMENTRLNASVETRRSKIETMLDGHLEPLNGPFDIVVLSNILNEVAGLDPQRIAKRVGILKRVMSELLADDGSCLIVEPSLRETSREMLKVRDGLLEERFHIYSPCLVREPCPALANPKDWCHEDIPWEPPTNVKEVDRLVGLRKDSLKFSYLVIRKDTLSISDVYGKDSFRVISEPLVSKGKMEFYICGPGGRRLITRLDKDKTAKNEALERLNRGAIVVFNGLVDEGRRLKVGKETGIAIKMDLREM